jgi:UPF0755 protein
MTLWNGIQRGASTIVYLWLTGVIFLLFIAGYILYGILWVVRYVQLRKKLLFIILPIAVAVVTGGSVYYLFFPLPGQHDTMTIVISRGCTVHMIADTLSQYRIITSKKALIAWLKVSRIDRRIQAGKFSFMTRTGAVAAARALTRPVPLDRTVTISEGLTMEQTAELIEKTFTIDTTEFIRLCRDTGLIQELGLDAAPSVEGYLFPDTYSFHETETPAEMIRRMVARFNEEWAKIDTAALASHHLTRRQIVIVASIVEKEAMLGAERPRIAGVFFNRLRLGLPLGADPTVRYIFRKWSGPLYISELNCTSPYNTRRNRGLPPGPICSPGRASLIAAVSPMQTNELYFVAKWDGSGGHDFSATNEDHARKTMLIRQNNKRRKAQKETSCRN